MITPGCDEIVKLAAEYSTIPVCREIYADMTTPIALLRRFRIEDGAGICHIGAITIAYLEIVCIRSLAEQIDSGQRVAEGIAAVALQVIFQVLIR